MEEEKKPPAKRSPGSGVDPAGRRELENLDELVAMMSNLSVIEREMDVEFNIDLMLEHLQHLSLNEVDSQDFDRAIIDQIRTASSPMFETNQGHEDQSLLVDILNVLQSIQDEYTTTLVPDGALLQVGGEILAALQNDQDRSLPPTIDDFAIAASDMVRAHMEAGDLDFAQLSANDSGEEDDDEGEPDVMGHNVFNPESLLSILLSATPESGSLEDLLTNFPTGGDENKYLDRRLLREILSHLVTMQNGLTGTAEDISDGNVHKVSVDFLCELTANSRERVSMVSFMKEVRLRARYTPIAPRPSTVPAQDEVDTPALAKVDRKSAKKSSNRPKRYNKQEEIIVPRDLFRQVNQEVLEEQKDIVKALAASKKSAGSEGYGKTEQISEDEGSRRGGKRYKCNMCYKPLGPNHTCAYLRVPRHALEQMRDHIPDMPRVWRDILDMYRNVDEVRRKRKEKDELKLFPRADAKSATGPPVSTIHLLDDTNNDEKAALSEVESSEATSHFPSARSNCEGADGTGEAAADEDAGANDVERSEEESSKKKRRTK